MIIIKIIINYSTLEPRNYKDSHNMEKTWHITPNQKNLMVPEHAIKRYSSRWINRKQRFTLMFFGVFLTVHHSIELFHQPTLMHNFLYSLTIRLLHYYPRHVSSINMPIFRRKNCIHTASGIFALCKRLPSTLVESGLTVRSQPKYWNSLHI